MTASRLVSLFLAGTLFLAVTGCMPVIRCATGISSLEPRQLAARLAEPDPPLVLDVRSPEEYREGHIPGSLSIQAQDVEAYLARAPVPPGRTVVVAGSRERISLIAAASGAGRHRGTTADLAGGIDAWKLAGIPLEQGPGEPITPAALAVQTRDMGRLEQGIAYMLAAVVKPGYMLLCLALILVLARARAWARTAAPPLRLLFWGLVSFDIGEAFCALDFYTLTRGGLLHPLDLLHGAGMVGMGVLASWALFRLADDRILRYGDPRQPCAIQRFCGTCWKREDVTCGMHSLFMFFVPALAILSLIPLTRPLKPIHYLSYVFSTPVLYGPPLLNELVEIWGYSLLGTLCFITALLALRGGPGSTRRAELPFFLGIGFFSFALFRFFLHSSFQEALNWSDFWEEITELIAIMAIALVLYLFRFRLGLKPPVRDKSPTIRAYARIQQQRRHFNHWNIRISCRKLGVAEVKHRLKQALRSPMSSDSEKPDQGTFLTLLIRALRADLGSLDSLDGKVRCSANAGLAATGERTLSPGGTDIPATGASLPGRRSIS